MQYFYICCRFDNGTGNNTPWTDIFRVHGMIVNEKILPTCSYSCEVSSATFAPYNSSIILLWLTPDHFTRLWKAFGQEKVMVLP